MYDGNSRSIYTEFDTTSIEFQEFMAWMYCNFESCALKYGFTGKYYYDHIREIMWALKGARNEEIQQK